MEDADKRLREIRGDVANLTSSLLWAEYDLKKSVERSQSILLSSEMLLSNILDQNLHIKNDVFRINLDLRSYFATTHDDLVAIAERSAVSADIIKASVVDGNNRIENAVSSVSPNELIKSLAPRETNVTPIAGLAGNVIPPTLLKKVELVLDASAVFLKAWSNPVNVGIALALPILAGVGVLVFGVVKAIEALAKPIENITAPLQGLGKLIGSFGGSDTVKVEQGADIATSIDAAAEALGPSIAAMDVSIDEINTNLGLVLEQMKNGKQVQQASFVDFTPLVNSIENAMSRLLFALPTAEPEKKDDRHNVQTMTRFENEVLTLLSNPIKVSVQNAAPQNPEVDSRVFADAITPLVSGQNAMYKMLDSNLRKLTVELQNLKEAPRANDISRATKINDTMNTSLSDTTESMILAESQAIREVVTKFREEFSEFKTTWITKINASSERKSSSDFSSKSGD